MLHLGTLIAVLIFFRKDVLEICKALILALKNRDFSDVKAKLALYIIIGTIVTICLALPLNDIADHLVFHPALVGGLLIVTGAVLFFSEYLSKRNQEKSESVNLKVSGKKPTFHESSNSFEMSHAESVKITY